MIFHPTVLHTLKEKRKVKSVPSDRFILLLITSLRKISAKRRVEDTRLPATTSPIAVDDPRLPKPWMTAMVSWSSSWREIDWIISSFVESSRTYLRIKSIFHWTKLFINTNNIMKIRKWIETHNKTNTIYLDWTISGSVSFVRLLDSEGIDFKLRFSRFHEDSYGTKLCLVWNVAIKV